MQLRIQVASLRAGPVPQYFCGFIVLAKNSGCHTRWLIYVHLNGGPLPPHKVWFGQEAYKTFWQSTSSCSHQSQAIGRRFAAFVSSQCGMAPHQCWLNFLFLSLETSVLSCLCCSILKVTKQRTCDPDPRPGIKQICLWGRLEVLLLLRLCPVKDQGEDALGFITVHSLFQEKEIFFLPRLHALNSDLSLRLCNNPPPFSKSFPQTVLRTTLEFSITHAQASELPRMFCPAVHAIARKNQ